MKAVLFVLTAVLLAGCIKYETKLPTTKNYGVARLGIIVDHEEVGYCTVWKIENDMAITAGHCCTSVEEVLVEREQRKQFEKFIKLLQGEEVTEEEETEEKPPVIEYTAYGNAAVKGAKFKVLRDDDANDVCVLQGPMNGLPISIASQEPAVGERVWTLGYPKGVFLISDGYWSGMWRQDTMVASTAIWGGASGSPVLNENGEAVALLVRYMPPMSNMTLMTPIEWLVANVKSAQRVLTE